LIWGGRRLDSVLGKPLGSGTQYAESWEVSDHRDDVSRVAEGPLIGSSLRDLVRHRGHDLLGAAIAPRDQFPLLVKFIDAHQVLSVQVHPDDERGRRLANDNGKTEAWVVIHSEPGGLIYAGLRPGVTRDDFAQALKANQVEPLLHRFETKPGDCIAIPAGTVHAIGAGVLLAEIQQMSDATFRVHDWGRVGADGKPRQLHLAEALESLDFSTGPVNPLTPRLERIPGGTRESLARCEYFALERLRLDGPTRLGDPERFTILLGLSGDSVIRTHDGGIPLRFGQTVLLPAQVGQVEVAPKGEVVILTCVVP
jgi:mannose-6-phosphate isomerase